VIIIRRFLPNPQKYVSTPKSVSQKSTLIFRRKFKNTKILCVYYDRSFFKKLINLKENKAISENLNIS